jgi:RNA 3'-terminal phosphate cyclase-like protein
VSDHEALSQAANWVDEGMVKRIRGVSFSTRVSAEIERNIIYAARGIFNRFIPDVYIFTDHRSGPSGGKYVSCPIRN